MLSDPAPASVDYDDGSRIFRFSLAASVYGFCISADRTEIQHLHWGPPLSLDALARIADGAQLTNADRIAHARDMPLEYSASGGLCFDEPSVKVEFADGTRVPEWHVAGHEIVREDTSVKLTVTLVDDYYPLSLDLCYRAFDGHDVLERWVELAHVGQGEPILLHLARSAAWWPSGTGPWTVRYLHGGWGRETQLVESELTPGKVVLESRRGVTGHQLNPWFTLNAAGAADERRGYVWSGALAWSGSWKLVFETTSTGRLQVTGGWNDFDSPLLLASGERVGLPVFAGLWSSGGYGGVSRAWHRYQREHVLAAETRSGCSPSFPRAAVRSASPMAPRPVLYNSWEATEFAVDVPQQLELAARAAAVGAELFVLDDGWFRHRHDDRSGLGDWSPDTKKFPDGLGPLVRAVHDLGMGFGIWVEPEMVNPDSDLYRAHPDWVYHFEHRRRSEWRNQLVLNLARADVAAWVYDVLDGLLSQHDIDFVKWDMNRSFSEPGWPGEEHNPERIWVRHVTALYDILERLRVAHPRVAFESCASGGGRVDLGILSRVEQVWTSDNTDAWDRVAIQEGFSQVYAPVTMMSWVTDSPNPLTARLLPLDYRFHVAMAGALGIGGDLRGWTDVELDQAADLVARYKEIRHVVQLGDQYRLASIRDAPLGAVEYVTPDGADVVVLAWWGVRPFAPYPARLALEALDPFATYEDIDSGEVREGADLMATGLDLPSRLDYGSVLVRLRRVSRREPIEADRP